VPEQSKQTRTYNSPLRRQRAAATHERIVRAGVDLLHGYPIWDWDVLTVRAIAQQAGVNERTVYRYFASEGELRDAVLQRLREQAGVHLEGMRLEDLSEMVARTFEFVRSFRLEPRNPPTPTIAAENERQRAAVRAAIEEVTPNWSSADRAIATGIIDVLWSVASYERLVMACRLSPDDAIAGVTWVLTLLEEAMRAGRAPSDLSDPARSRPQRRTERSRAVR
jgi:AcrR family transcriptional regulator